MVRPVSLACTECRRKHLRCNGRQPCTRCIDSTCAERCSFTSSRRGLKDKSAPSQAKTPDIQNVDEVERPETVSSLFNLERFPDASWPDGSVLDEIWDLGEPSEELNHVNDAGDTCAIINDEEIESLRKTAPIVTETRNVMAVPSFLSNASSGRDELVNTNSPFGSSLHISKYCSLYYEFFHRAHPVLLPKQFFNVHMVPEYLRIAIEFVGSQYDPSSRPGYLKSRLQESLAASNDHNIYRVQALVIMAIALHARNEQVEALSAISMAADSALAIGLNKRSFLSSSCHGHALVQENARRTWWELFIVNAFLAASHHRSDILISAKEIDMDIPCDEVCYERGLLTNYRNITLAHLENRYFVDDDLEMPSYAYRIEAVQLLRRVLQLLHAFSDNFDEADAIDARLGSWVHSTPQAQSRLLTHDGDIDEILFQAHMAIQGATITLHLSRSGMLSQHPMAADNECASTLPLTIPTSTPHESTIKANFAAHAIASLASLRGDIRKHTPFFTCTLVMGAVVQLSACSNTACRCLEPRRDRIVQAISLLRTLSCTWPIASEVLKQLKSVSNEIISQGMRQEVTRQRAALSAIESIDEVFLSP